MELGLGCRTEAALEVLEAQGDLGESVGLQHRDIDQEVSL
jgi:hypothetical protein